MIRRERIIYLQAISKSALWLGPTYLYCSRATQMTSKKRFLETTAVVSLLYDSKGIPLLLSTRSPTDWFVILAWAEPLVISCSISSLDGVIPKSELVASGGKLPSVHLITSNTLLLICKIKEDKYMVCWSYEYSKLTITKKFL